MAILTTVLAGDSLDDHYLKNYIKQLYINNINNIK